MNVIGQFSPGEHRCVSVSALVPGIKEEVTGMKKVICSTFAPMYRLRLDCQEILWMEAKGIKISNESSSLLYILLWEGKKENTALSHKYIQGIKPHRVPQLCDRL